MQQLYRIAAGLGIRFLLLLLLNDFQFDCTFFLAALVIVVNVIILCILLFGCFFIFLLVDFVFRYIDYNLDSVLARFQRTIFLSAFP